MGNVMAGDAHACVSMMVRGTCLREVTVELLTPLGREHGWSKHLGDDGGQGHTGTRDLKAVPMGLWSSSP